MTFLNKIIHDEYGATAIEYGLIAALIAIAAMVVIQGLGDQLDSSFALTSSAMSSANSAATAA